MKKFLKFLGIGLGIIVILICAGVIYFNSTYPKITPPPNVKVEITPEKVSRGEYLSQHVTICSDCHSTRDWSKFSGPIIASTEGMGGEVFDEENIGFPGTLVSKNITPYNLANWTDGEIIRAVTQGITKDEKPLFPLMPYMNYNNMTEEDLHSVIAYLRSLKPIKKDNPEHNLNFPLNFIVKTLPLQTYKPAEIDKNNPLAYGKYLVTIASCGDCHTPSEKGEPIKGMDFAGGREFQSPAIIIRSANLTPDEETGIGKWKKEDFIKRFKSYSTEEAKNISVKPTDFNTVMPWTMYAGMTEEDLGAIYEYLRTLKPVKNNVIHYKAKSLASN